MRMPLRSSFSEPEASSFPCEMIAMSGAETFDDLEHV
jgi:hypothetical protein